MVKNGVLITPVLTDDILESITRDTILKLAQQMQIKTQIRSVDRTEVYTADEAFLCGSAMELTPILSVDQYELGEGEITRRLHEMYLSVVTGQRKEYEDWLTPIY